MWHRQEPRPQLTGVLWMTSLDALSPFFRVPLPSTNDDCETYSTQPSAWLLRALTLTAFLTNWVAWLSRVEYSASLGMTRVSPAFVSVPVAAGLLQPYSLGCGQAPLMGMWPMWLLRQVLIFSIHLLSYFFAYEAGSVIQAPCSVLIFHFLIWTKFEFSFSDTQIIMRKHSRFPSHH